MCSGEEPLPIAWRIIVAWCTSLLNAFGIVLSSAFCNFSSRQMCKTSTIFSTYETMHERYDPSVERLRNEVLRFVCNLSYLVAHLFFNLDCRNFRPPGPYLTSPWIFFWEPWRPTFNGNFPVKMKFLLKTLGYKAEKPTMSVTWHALLAQAGEVASQSDSWVKV